MSNMSLIRKFFKRYDLRKDGEIDFSEFKEVFATLVHKKWIEIMKKLIQK